MSRPPSSELRSAASSWSAGKRQPARSKGHITISRTICHTLLAPIGSRLAGRRPLAIVLVAFRGTEECDFLGDHLHHLMLSTFPVLILPRLNPPLDCNQAAAVNIVGAAFGQRVDYVESEAERLQQSFLSTSFLLKQLSFFGPG